MVKILLPLLLCTFSLFSYHPLVHQGNDFYFTGKYEEAYRSFSTYLHYFSHCGSLRDYHIAFIGKSHSAFHLPKEICLEVDNTLFIEMIEDASDDLYESRYVKDLLSDSVFNK